MKRSLRRPRAAAGYALRTAALWLAAVVALASGCLNPRPEELPSDTTLPDEGGLASENPDSPRAPVGPPLGNDGNFGGDDEESPPGRPEPGGSLDADAGAPAADAGRQTLDGATGVAPSGSAAGEEPE